MFLICVSMIGILSYVTLPQMFGIQLAAFPSYAFVNGHILQLDPIHYEKYWNTRSTVITDTIYPGVWVDDIDVGGLTMVQAVKVVEDAALSDPHSFSVTVMIDGMQWVVDSGMVPLKRNTE